MVTVNNSSIEYYAKDGSEEGQPTALNDLFGLSYNAGWGIADEEIYFDSSLGVTGRFIVTADATNIHATDDQHPYGTTKLIVAVSQSNNLGQNSAWNINWIDTSFPTWTISGTKNGVPFTDYFPNFLDQPRFSVDNGDLFICAEPAGFGTDGSAYYGLVVVHESSLTLQRYVCR